MSNLDDALRQALSHEDRAYLERYAKEPSLIGEFAQAVTGRYMFIHVLVLIAAVCVAAVSLYAGVRLFSAEPTLDALRWGLGALGGVMILIGIRIWFWLEMQTNRVLRELKRLELQIAHMSAGSAQPDREPRA